MGELLERCLGLKILLNGGFEIVVLLDITLELRKPDRKQYLHTSLIVLQAASAQYRTKISVILSLQLEQRLPHNYLVKVS